MEHAARHRRQRRWSSGRWRTRPSTGRLTLAEIVVFAQTAVGTSMIAFGGLSWATDGAAAPVGGGPPARAGDATGRGARLRLASGRGNARRARDPVPRRRRFAYPGGAPVLDHFDLTFRRARRSRSSARTAPARRPSPSCCAGCTTRSRARSKSTASISASSISRRGDRGWRPCSRITCGSSCRFETTWRRSERPMRRSRAALDAAGAGLAEPGHGARPRLQRRHRSVRRPVATGGAGRALCAGADAHHHPAVRRLEVGRDLRLEIAGSQNSQDLQKVDLPRSAFRDL